MAGILVKLFVWSLGILLTNIYRTTRGDGWPAGGGKFILVRSYYDGESNIYFQRLTFLKASTHVGNFRYLI